MNYDATANILCPFAETQSYSVAETVSPRYQPVLVVSANSVSEVSYVRQFTNSATGFVTVPTNDEFAEHFRKLGEILTNQSLWPDGAERPNETASSWAKVVLQKVREYALPPSRVVAAADGGIAICFVNGAKYSDIECLNSGELLAVNSDKRHLPAVWEIKHEANDIALSVSRIRDFITSS